MKVSDFDFHLSEDLIAQYPAPQRTGSRLLCLDKVSGQITHNQFTALADYLKPGDLLVFNDTRVIPARLHGHKTSGAKVELLVERVLDRDRVLAHIKANRAPKAGCQLMLSGVGAQVMGRQDDLFEVQFDDKRSVFDILDEIGSIPLPPYISRQTEEEDRLRYQTVYARQAGAVAAPTAGLHFDQTMLEQLRKSGIEFAFVTLHVGAGTFQPVRVERIDEHVMHSEQMNLSTAVAEQIRATKARGKRVIAVGTTSVRCLETVAQRGEIQAYTGETDIFIYPGYRYQLVDAMLTNFHLPQSTLLMLVAAFTGYDTMMKAYQEAVAEQYQFFSYGDAMFIY